MGEINISNSKGRDAVVATESLRSYPDVRWLDEKGRQVIRVALIQSTMDRDYDALKRQFGGDDAKLADALVAGDPELDFERYGREAGRLWRIWQTGGKVVHHVAEFDVIRSPDGTLKERRPRQASQSNTNAEGAPLKWTGKKIPKTEAAAKLVFSGTRQLVHVNGLTRDFLYAMAKELETEDALLLLGAGPKGAQPLVFRRGGANYRGFLEGRTDGERYALLLHLSNLELKVPAQAAPAEAAAAGEATVATKEGAA